MDRPPLSTRPRATSGERMHPSTSAPRASPPNEARSNGTLVFVATGPPVAPNATAHVSASARSGARSPAQMVQRSHKARRPRGSLALRNQLSTWPARDERARAASYRTPPRSERSAGAEADERFADQSRIDGFSRVAFAEEFFEAGAGFVKACAARSDDRCLTRLPPPRAELGEDLGAGARMAHAGQ